MKVKNKNLIYIVFTAVFAAMITLMTAYICHIPNGVNNGYIHLGDTFIILAATILPKPYAIAAAAIGGGLADLLTAPMWILPTIIIKSLIALPFTSKGEKIVIPRNVVCIIFTAIITIGGYYIAEALLFGSWVAPAASVVGNIIQSFGSGIVFVILGTALDKVKFRNRIAV